MSTVPTLKSVMTPFPYSVASSARIEAAREMMIVHGIRHLPVLDGSELVGIVSDRDIKCAMDPRRGAPTQDRIHVRDIMVKDVYTVDLHTSLEQVLFQLAHRHIGCAVVLNEGQVAGIFTTTDACRSYGELLRRLTPHRPGDDVA